MKYEIYYKDSNGQLESPGDNRLTATEREAAETEFRECAESLSELEGWSATEYVLVQKNDDGYGYEEILSVEFDSEDDEESD